MSMTGPLEVLHVDAISRSFSSRASTVLALQSVSFTVNESEIVCVVGPSGCGKTTLLRCISGLLAPSGGRATLDGRPISGTPEGLALVSQDYSRSLLPWLRVRANVELPLKARRVPAPERRRRVAEALEAVGLHDSTHAYPWQLSGGMQQRVAIARALAYAPRILLMDEPFASVDAQTREELEDLVLRVRDQYRMTVMLVTHDIDEAVYLADRVVVLTNRPTVVNEVVSVPLGRERDQVSTKEMSEFVAIRGHVARLIHGTKKAMSPSTSGARR